MPRYHLHLHNAHVEASDVEGHDLPDLAAAKTMALNGIRDFLVHEAMHGKLDLRGQVDVADDLGVILLSVSFLEAVKIIKPAGWFGHGLAAYAWFGWHGSRHWSNDRPISTHWRDDIN